MSDYEFLDMHVRLLKEISKIGTHEAHQLDYFFYQWEKGDETAIDRAVIYMANHKIPVPLTLLQIMSFEAKKRLNGENYSPSKYKKLKNKEFIQDRYLDILRLTTFCNIAQEEACYRVTQFIADNYPDKTIKASSLSKKYEAWKGDNAQRLIKIWEENNAFKHWTKEDIEKYSSQFPQLKQEYLKGQRR